VAELEQAHGLLGPVVVQVHPAQAVERLRHQRRLLDEAGVLEGAGEVTPGRSDDAHIERGPAGQQMQVGHGHVQRPGGVLADLRPQELLGPADLGQGGVADRASPALVVERAQLRGDAVQARHVSQTGVSRRRIPRQGERLGPRLGVEDRRPDGQLGRPGHRPNAVVILGAGRRRLADQVRGRVVVGETEVAPGHAQPIGDAGQYVVRDDLAAAENLGDLRLGLSGERRDPTLRDTHPLQQPEHRGDVARGQRRAHIRPPPQRRIDPILRPPVADQRLPPMARSNNRRTLTSHRSAGQEGESH
jgi:hypothetical protein